MRAIVVFAFIALGPGWALVRRLDLEGPLRWMLIVTTSLAVTAIGSEALAIAGVWSAPRLLIVLVALTLGGALLPMPRGRHR